MNNNENESDDLNGVAIIGMAGRFPKAKNIDEFWQNLCRGVECITFYDDQELIDAGIDPEVIKHPEYVKAKGEVDDVDMFDASFFGINPREAEVTDPQHRMLLECAWEALENACYDSSKFDGHIGVFAGKSMDYYLLLNVYPHIRKEISAGSLLAAVGNDKDSLTTTISYRLNLTGPGITVQTSSSTSLVSVCVACQSLLTYQCDIALAGGITAGPPTKSGYQYQEGNIWSPDGRCRAFDARAKGFVPGCGMGLVVLKRLEDAILDRDHIWAVIKGFAVNNDGSNKVSYHAPSVDAQTEVVASALAVANVNPETIGYVETHGTGTNLGDPIEVTALTQAFRAYTYKKQYCAIGSVKTNIGHLDNAAGVVGLIKTALSLKHKLIPPSLHFEKPNPKIDFENSPFFVNSQLKEWISERMPRRAGVTSLGMGGTNAHVVLEEAPEHESSEISRHWHVLLLSAKTATALENMTANLANYFKENPGLNLADAAYTLKLGRRDFNYRRAVLCQELEDARASLADLTPGRVFDSVCDIVERPVVFMFSGQGTQYVNMGKELYQEEPLFKENMDKCARLLKPLLNIDPLQLIYAEKEDIERNAGQLRQTWLTQPVLFMLEYSLAQLWLDWGIVPVGMIGHSIGEFVAACISGCMSLEDVLKIVVARGRLMHEQEKGSMLSLGISESEVAALLGEDLSLAAVNSPKHCVISGRTEAVDRLEKQLSAKNIFCKQLRTSHAFHSPMMESIMKEFAGEVSKVKLNPPKIPFISGVTGTWIKDEDACSAQYWAEQLRKPVRFSNGILEILTDPARILLEVGAGNSLCLLAREHKTDQFEPVTFSSIRHIKQTDTDTAFLLKTLGSLWLSGVTINWINYHKHEKNHRLPLPSYPFERKRYWLEEAKFEMVQMEEETSVEAEPVKIEAKEENKAFQARPVLPNEYLAPGDDIEKDIVEIWEDILGIRPIGITDNFFDLGGHSLLATLFLSRLQEQFQVRLEMRTIFEEPTVACIAGLVKDKQSKTTDLEKIENILQEIEEDMYTSLVPAKEQEYYTLSSAQERLFMMQYIDLESESYNMTGVMRMVGKLKKQQFEQAFSRLIERHESLRTSFELVAGEPRQRIHPVVEFKIEYHEAGSGKDENGKIETGIIKDFIRPFDLTQAPLLRLGLIQLEEREHILMFDMHHIISDGASMNLLIKDLTAFYSGLELPTLRIQYKDFCQWQNNLLKSDILKKQEEYWLNQFSGKVPVLNMPTDYPRPRIQSFKGAITSFYFDQELTRRLNRLIRETGTTLFMMLLALYNILLSKYTRQEDIIIGLPIAGRNHRDLENVIGLFMETLALRNFPQGDKPFDKFLEEVKDNTLNAFDNQTYPFGELLNKVVKDKNHSRNPLFDAMLIVQNIEGDLEEIEIDELRLVPYKDAAPLPAKVDISLEAEERDDKIAFHLKYCTKLFKKETMERFARIFQEIASAVVANKGIQLKDINISYDLVAAESGVYKGSASEFDF